MKSSPLDAQAFVERHRDRRRHRVDALAAAPGKCFATAATRVARELEEGLGVRMLDRDVAHARAAGALPRRLVRAKRQRAVDDIAVDDCVEQRRVLQQLAAATLAPDTIMLSAVSTPNGARQPLRAAGARQQAELHLGQRDRRCGAATR